MREFNLVAFSVAISILFGSSIEGRAQEQNYIPNQVIVKFKKDVQIDSADRIRTNLKAAIAKRLGVIRAELWKISGITVEQAIRRFRTDQRIEFIEPNYIVYAHETIPGDPEFEALWGMNNTGQTGGTIDADIDAPKAWDTQTDCRNLVVGVIDTGIDYKHPDLQANIWTNPGEIAGNGEDDDGNGFIDDVHGWDFVNNDNNPMDDHYHGTHVSGTIAAAGNNNRGVVGVCWRGQIMALKFLDSEGSGTTADAVEAIEYATMMKRDFGIDIRLTNNSWGGSSYSRALYEAIRASEEADMLFVAAAGNSSSNNDLLPNYPSNFDLDGIISVAATEPNDNLSFLSNYGQISVDLGAPGSSILSTVTGGNYAYLSGTSMATPHVSGVVALTWSLNLQMSNLELKNIILNTVDPVDSLTDITVTGGRLNAFKAVKAVTDKVTPNNSAWSKLHDLSAKHIHSGYLDGNDQEDVIVDFGDPYGIYIWFNNSAWIQLHDLSAKHMHSGDLDGNDQEDVIVDFGDPYGIYIWFNNSAWSKLHDLSAKHMHSGDLDGNDQEDVIVDFGDPYGIYIWSINSAWSKLHDLSAKHIHSGYLDGNDQEDVIVDFGDPYGIYIWFNNSAWSKLHDLSAKHIHSGYLDGNDQEDVIVDFGDPYGIYIWFNNSTWIQLHDLSAKHMHSGDLDGNDQEDVIVDFGDPYGIYIWFNNSAWSKLHDLSAKHIHSGDLDGNDQEDVIVDFGDPYGIYIWSNNST